jgi:hypothetical protein
LLQDARTEMLAGATGKVIAAQHHSLSRPSTIPPIPAAPYASAPYTRGSVGSGSGAGAGAGAGASSGPGTGAGSKLGNGGNASKLDWAASITHRGSVSRASQVTPLQ